METLIINSTTSNTQIPRQQNEIRLDFKSSVLFKDQQVALGYLSIYYSWFNISKAYNNNSFSYKWINGITYNCNLDDSFMAINDLNKFMQQQMFLNGHYMLDSNANPVYYIRFSSNASLYCVTFDVYPVTVPLGGVNFNNIVLNTPAVTPQLVIPNNKITLCLGIAAGIYPTTPTVSTYSFNSTSVPVIQKVTTVYVTCNLVNSVNNLYRSVFYSFAPSVLFGSRIDKEPFNPMFYDVPDGTYQSISLTFVDQNYQAIYIVDPDIAAMIVFKDKKSKVNV